MATLAIVNPRRRRRRKGRKARRSRRRASLPFANLKHNKRRRRSRGKRGGGKRRRVARRSGFGGLRFGGIGGKVMATLKPAATAAVGALTLDVVWSYLPIPAAAKVGVMRHVAKGAGAVALGMVAERVVGREKGRLFAIGAMTVVLHGILRDFVATTLPNVRLADWGDGTDFPTLNYWGSAPNVGGLGEYVEASGAIPDSSASGSCPPATMGVYDPLDPGYAE